jgi:hypothetical protein
MRSTFQVKTQAALTSAGVESWIQPIMVRLPLRATKLTLEDTVRQYLSLINESVAKAWQK